MAKNTYIKIWATSVIYKIPAQSKQLSKFAQSGHPVCPVLFENRPQAHKADSFQSLQHAFKPILGPS
jgi:hypothetical protein